MKFLFLIFSMIFMFMPTQSFAISQAKAKEAFFGLNRAAPEQMRKQQLGNLLVSQKVWTLEATYDFSTQGGSIGAINLKDPTTGQDAVLPKNAIVRDCLIDVVTDADGGVGATIAIGTGQSSTDLKAATGFASYTGLVACVPVGTAATAIKLTADRTPKITIATAALTAGKFHVWIDYVVNTTD